MSCCGKTIKKVKAIENIAEGKISALVEKLSGKEIAKCEKYDSRISMCKTCRHNTYLTKYEYAKWLLSHGVEVLKNIDDLTNLPVLPKSRKGDLYCRVCKCNLEAKCRVKTERCPYGRW